MVSLDEETLKAHIEGGVFQDGVSRREWRLLKISWPCVWIAISAAAKENSPAEYAFRFECTNYPQDATTACPWDVEKDAPLAIELWPGGTGRIAIIFNPDWKKIALYVAMDRIALDGHDWRTQLPATAWNARKEIAHYLGLIHGLLNSPNYKGTRSSISSN